MAGGAAGMDIPPPPLAQPADIPLASRQADNT
jgi:hypothetical protein